MAANSKFAVATHVLLSLAVSPEEKKSSDYLAGSVNTNPVVIRRILGELQKAGLVKTQLGKGGGAYLGKPAEKITLFEIYQALDDGGIFGFNVNKPNTHCPLSCKMKSILEPIFSSAESAVSSELKKQKLSDLVAKLK